jgi:hypothetical protein
MNLVQATLLKNQKRKDKGKSKSQEPESDSAPYVKLMKKAAVKSQSDSLLVKAKRDFSSLSDNDILFLLRNAHLFKQSDSDWLYDTISKDLNSSKVQKPDVKEVSVEAKKASNDFFDSIMDKAQPCPFDLKHLLLTLHAKPGSLNFDELDFVAASYDSLTKSDRSALMKELIERANDLDPKRIEEYSMRSNDSIKQSMIKEGRTFAEDFLWYCIHSKQTEIVKEAVQQKKIDSIMKDLLNRVNNEQKKDLSAGYLLCTYPSEVVIALEKELLSWTNLEIVSYISSSGSCQVVFLWQGSPVRHSK